MRFVVPSILVVVSIMMLSTTATALASTRTIATRFVLIQTHHKGNVGAAARALKTMGFDDLRLVQPRDPKVLNRQRTKEAASGAVNVLENTQIHDSLEEAVAGCTNVCATGMPHSMSITRPDYEFQAPRAYFEKLINNKEEGDIRIAFLFGNERVGMAEEDVLKSHVVLGIPTNPVSSNALFCFVVTSHFEWQSS